MRKGDWREAVMVACSHTDTCQVFSVCLADTACVFVARGVQDNGRGRQERRSQYI